MKMKLRVREKEKKGERREKRVNESSMLSNQAENGGTDLCTLSFFSIPLLLMKKDPVSSGQKLHFTS